MAQQKSIAVAFTLVTLFLGSSLPLSTLEREENEGAASNDDDGRDADGQHTHIIEKYGIVWTRSSLTTLREDFSNFNDDIESVECTSDINCTAALPGVDAALQYDSDIPSKPYCIMPLNGSSENNTSTCTCGFGRCVSYSRDSTTRDPFYYCGPCGYVGSKCTNSCFHKLAECRGGYCECTQEGTFYDMTYCYIPFYGQQLLINILIATSVLLLCCAALAYGYHKLGNRRRRRRASLYNERGNGSARRESPSDDTPPAYDDVMEKLPSYQDALQMVDKGDADKGLSNPAFEEDNSGKPNYKTGQDSTAPNAASLSQTKSLAPSPSQCLNHSASSTLSRDIASFPQNSSPDECNDSMPVVIGEQQGLGTQPIELLLHNTLQTQHTTTTL